MSEDSEVLWDPRTRSDFQQSLARHRSSVRTYLIFVGVASTIIALGVAATAIPRGYWPATALAAALAILAGAAFYGLTRTHRKELAEVAFTIGEAEIWFTAVPTPTLLRGDPADRWPLAQTEVAIRPVRGAGFLYFTGPDGKHRRIAARSLALPTDDVLEEFDSRKAAALGADLPQRDLTAPDSLREAAVATEHDASWLRWALPTVSALLAIMGLAALVTVGLSMRGAPNFRLLSLAIASFFVAALVFRLRSHLASNGFRWKNDATTVGTGVLIAAGLALAVVGQLILP